MTILNCTLLNFAHADILAPIFENYSNDFKYTTNGIFRRIVSPDCPKCGHRMNHNGYNEHCKKRLGSVKIGIYLCPICKEPLEESRSFREQLKTDFFNVLGNIYQRFRIHNLSYDGMTLPKIPVKPLYPQVLLQSIRRSQRHQETKKRFKRS